LNIVGGQFSEFGALEHFSQVLERTLIHFMRFRSAEWRPGEVLQIKVRPFAKGEILSAAQRRQRVVVSGLQPFPEALLRFVPVFGESRFASADAVLIAVPHPPDLRTLALVQAAIVLHWSCQFTTSCLNCARKGSRSDFKNRMFRPITRRWGICFRSTQRYTVCTLTPRKRAASSTLMGSSAVVLPSTSGRKRTLGS